MPSFVIHTAIGKQYLKKHKNNENYEEFITGNLQPDLTKNKQETHYGKSPAYTNLKEFLLHNNLDTSLNKGKFLHLIADYLFYNHYLDRISKEIIYNDYDIINKDIINKYDVQLPKELEQYVSFKEGIPEILTLDLALKVIEEVSNLDIPTVQKELLENNKKWFTYKNLI